MSSPKAFMWKWLQQTRQEFEHGSVIPLFMAITCTLLAWISNFLVNSDAFLGNIEVVSSGFESRIVLLIDWLPSKATKSSLPCYLTYNGWVGEKMDSCISQGHESECKQTWQEFEWLANSVFHADNYYITYSSKVLVII